MKNLPKTSKKPPQNLPKSLPKASQNEDPFQNHEKAWNPMLLLAPFGLLFCSFSPLGPIKKNEYFQALPGSAIGTILGAFWTNFNDFWSAKTSPEDDRWHIWKTLNFIVGVINFKGPRVSETLKNDSKNTKNLRVRWEPPFFMIFLYFNWFRWPFGAPKPPQKPPETLFKKNKKKKRKTATTDQTDGVE